MDGPVLPWAGAYLGRGVNPPPSIWDCRRSIRPSIVPYLGVPYRVGYGYFFKYDYVFKRRHRCANSPRGAKHLSFSPIYDV